MNTEYIALVIVSFVIAAIYARGTVDTVGGNVFRFGANLVVSFAITISAIVVMLWTLMIAIILRG